MNARAMGGWLLLCATSAFGQSYGGIGTQLDTSGGIPIVIALVPDAPAARAGIWPGDRILAVDGRAVAGVPIDSTTALLRGQIGTAVTLMIDRPGQAQPVPFSVTRQEIGDRPVSWILARRALTYYAQRATLDTRGHNWRLPPQQVRLGPFGWVFLDSGEVKWLNSKTGKSAPFSQWRTFMYATMGEPKNENGSVTLMGFPNLLLGGTKPDKLREVKFSFATPQDANGFVLALHDARNAAGMRDSAEKLFATQAAAWRAANPKPALSPRADRHRILAEQAMREKNVAKAMYELESALLLDPTWSSGNYNLALLHESAEDGMMAGILEAARYMKRFLLLEPDSREAPAAREKVVIWEDKLRGGQ